LEEEINGAKARGKVQANFLPSLVRFAAGERRICKKCDQPTTETEK